jgi:hypothetical protein
VTDSLVMKVAISEIATPTLYQVMVNLKEPRERAAMLKRVAEAYLSGGSISSLTPANIMLQVASTAPLPVDLAAPFAKEKQTSSTNGKSDEKSMSAPGPESRPAPDDGYKLDAIGDQFAGFA